MSDTKVRPLSQPKIDALKHVARFGTKPAVAANTWKSIWDAGYVQALPESRKWKVTETGATALEKAIVKKDTRPVVSPEAVLKALENCNSMVSDVASDEDTVRVYVRGNDFAPVDTARRLGIIADKLSRVWADGKDRVSVSSETGAVVIQRGPIEPTVPTYRVTFDRIGRNHFVDPTVITAATRTELEDKIFKFVRPFLASKGIEVYIDPDWTVGSISGGSVMAGFHPAGDFKLELVGSPEKQVVSSSLPSYVPSPVPSADETDSVSEPTTPHNPVTGDPFAYFQEPEWPDELKTPTELAAEAARQTPAPKSEYPRIIGHMNNGDPIFEAALATGNWPESAKEVTGLPDAVELPRRLSDVLWAKLRDDELDGLVKSINIRGKGANIHFARSLNAGKQGESARRVLASLRELWTDGRTRVRSMTPFLGWVQMSGWQDALSTQA